MHPYSHYHLATRLETLIKPAQPGEYYWGAIFPDIRYLTGMPREHTHVPRDQFPAWFSQYPHLRSFLQGYQLHCLLDELNLVSIVSRAFPINLIQSVRRRKFSRQQITILVELHHQQTGAPLHEFCAGENEIAAGLGIEPSASQIFAQGMREYIAHPTLETALAAYQRLGMVADSRVEKVIGAAQWLERNPWLKALLLLGVKNSGIDRLAVEHVRAALKAAPTMLS